MISFFFSEFRTEDWGDRANDSFPGPEEFHLNDTLDMEEVCFFKGHRTREVADNGTVTYNLNEKWYHIFAAKLAFVLVFEVRTTWWRLCT